MDIIYFIMLLMLIYFINPLKNEEKLFTTPFLTVSYLILFSYVLSVFNIPMYKYLYLLPLLIIFIYFLKNKKLNFKGAFSKIKLFNFKKSHLILMIILLFTIFIGYNIFPPNPANTTDTQYHSYKTKAMVEEKTIFYNTNEIPYKYYIYYPAGFHSIIYFLSSSVGDILNSIQFIKFYILILFVLGYYLIGESIKKGLGCWIALFLPLTNVVYRIIGVLLPNILGYAMMLVGIFFILQYRNTKNNIYLILFSFTIASLIYIHTFPLIITTLFLIAVSIQDIILRNGIKLFKFYNSKFHFDKKVINYWISFFGGVLFSISLIYSKMAKNIVSYGKSTNFTPEPISTIIHNILAGTGIFYLYILTKISLDNTNTFLISLVFTFLFILSIYYLLKLKNGAPFILLFILLILNIINIKFIHIYIPFFSSQYDSARMAMHIQIIMPIFYGSGCYLIYKLIENIKLINAKKYKIIKYSFISFIILFSIFSAYTNYNIIQDKHKDSFVIHNNDLKIFEYMNNHNITNETILNFGEDAGQFLPIYTENKPVFYFFKFQSNNTTVGNVSYENILFAIDSKNYSIITNACKNENIKYLYMSEYMGKYDEGFFENQTYFEIICKEGNAKLVKIK